MNKRIALLLLASTLLASCSHLPSWMGGAEDSKPKLPGERKLALAVEGQVEPDDSLKNKTPVLPAVSVNNDWEKNSSISGNLAGGKFDNKTSATIGGGIDFSHSLVPSPVVGGGLVFAMDAAGIVSAHDASDVSNIRWAVNAVADEDEREVFGGGLTLSSGVLYATTGQGQAAAINVANGAVLWKKNFATPLRGSPRVSGDKLVIMTIDSQTYGLSAKTGDILWDHRGINETTAVMNSVSPTIVGSYVLIPYASGELFTLSLADGKELWGDSIMQNQHTQASGVFTGIGGDPVVEGSVAFVTSNNGLTTAIDIEKGKRIWQQQAASINTPWLAGDDLFVLTADNVLVDMLKYSGKVRWVQKLASYEDTDSKQRPISWRGPVLVNGRLVVVSSNGQMVFVSATTGKVEETRDIPNNIVTAPVVAGGKLYLVSQDATLYSFQ